MPDYNQIARAYTNSGNKTHYESLKGNKDRPLRPQNYHESWENVTIPGNFEILKRYV